MNLSLSNWTPFGCVKTPFAVLEGIWKKAAEVMNDPLKISPAPGCSPFARMVEEKASFGNCRKRWKCDTDCPNYKAFGICSRQANQDLMSIF